jgi:hypothetical protein
MAATGWTNEITGRCLDKDELRHLQDCAHRLYTANTHIFEDEREALSALGVVPAFEVVPAISSGENHSPRCVAAETSGSACLTVDRDGPMTRGDGQSSPPDRGESVDRS